MTTYAEVAVTLPVDGRFHYSVPPHLEGALEVGHRVLVPFGRRRVTGFVTALAPAVAPEVAEKVRPILERMDLEPLVPRDVLALATFTADYYLATVGEVLRLALPPGLTAASKARWVITPAGRHFLDGGTDVLPNGARITTAERRFLEASVRGQGVKLADAPAKVVGALEALGLVAKKDTLAAREGGGGEVEVVERVAPGAVAAGAANARVGAEPDFGKKRTIREVWAKLALGAVPVEELVSELGKGVKVAIKELEARGLVTRRKIASDGARRAAVRAAPSNTGASGDPVPSDTVRSDTVPSDRLARTAVAAGPGLQVPPPLMPEQAAALDVILGRLEAREPGAFLLHGVTASGKTEVYLRAIAHVLAKGQGAIVLVPEIALTPQLESRFRARFGDEVAVLHSALTETERRRRWQRLRRGEARIALGPRSAIWAPVRDLAIIVVDEEHDPSFKQGSDVRYNGRDLALVRAHQVHGVALLGSATPSLESLQLVMQGKLTRLRMKDRVAGRPLPTVEVVDLAEERSEVGGEPRVLTRALADRLRDVVAKKGQAILFLNRRGFNTIVFCGECGAARHCSKCDVSLTHHKAIKSLVCHYCGHVERLDAPCRECKSSSMQPFGVGTQRVAEAVMNEVPDARVLRLDRDVTSNVGELDRTLDEFRQGKADVLVGTQMVAKGHDFPGVVLVGIVLADASLAFPDFRAAERTFQLLTQVAGRAGRAENPGHVIIQTFQKGHHALTSAIHHDTDGFFEKEVESRKDLSYPPFGRLGIIRFESREERALKRATEVAARAAQRLRSAEIRIQGPVEAPIAMIRERHRELMLVKAPTPAKLTGAMRKLRAALSELIESKVDVIYDVDPVDLL